MKSTALKFAESETRATDWANLREVDFGSTPPRDKQTKAEFSYLFFFWRGFGQEHSDLSDLLRFSKVLETNERALSYTTCV